MNEEQKNIGESLDRIEKDIEKAETAEKSETDIINKNIEIEEVKEAVEQEATEEVEEKKKGRKKTERKKKKAVKKRKSKKEKEDPIVHAIRLVTETGKVGFGAKTGIKNSLLGKVKLIIIAGNAPKELQEDISYYSKLSSIPIIIFEGTSMELGSICGKPYPISVLSIYDEGSSNIMDLVSSHGLKIARV